MAKKILRTAMDVDKFFEELKQEVGDRHNAGKPQLTLVLEADAALEGITKVLENGMAKYSRSNWRKGLHHVGIIDSMMRHVMKYLNGEDIDPESGLPHVDHIGCNALFLSQMFHTRKDLDNRSINAAPEAR